MYYTLILLLRLRGQGEHNELLVLISSKASGASAATCNILSRVYIYNTLDNCIIQGYRLYIQLHADNYMQSGIDMPQNNNILRYMHTLLLLLFSAMILNFCYEYSSSALFIQLQLTNIPSCKEYSVSNSRQKIEDIENTMAQNVARLCRCEFNSTLLSNSHLQCFDESPQIVTFTDSSNHYCGVSIVH